MIKKAIASFAIICVIESGLVKADWLEGLTHNVIEETLYNTSIPKNSVCKAGFNCGTRNNINYDSITNRHNPFGRSTYRRELIVNADSEDYEQDINQIDLNSAGQYNISPGNEHQVITLTPSMMQDGSVNTAVLTTTDTFVKQVPRISYENEIVEVPKKISLEIVTPKMPEIPARVEPDDESTVIVLNRVHKQKPAVPEYSPAYEVTVEEIISEQTYLDNFNTPTETILIQQSPEIINSSPCNSYTDPAPVSITVPTKEVHEYVHHVVPVQAKKQRIERSTNEYQNGDLLIKKNKVSTELYPELSKKEKRTKSNSRGALPFIQQPQLLPLYNSVSPLVIKPYQMAPGISNFMPYPNQMINYPNSTLPVISNGSVDSLFPQSLYSTVANLTDSMSDHDNLVNNLGTVEHLADAIFSDPLDGHNSFKVSGNINANVFNINNSFNSETIERTDYEQNEQISQVETDLRLSSTTNNNTGGNNGKPAIVTCNSSPSSSTCGSCHTCNNSCSSSPKTQVQHIYSYQPSLLRGPTSFPGKKKGKYSKKSSFLPSPSTIIPSIGNRGNYMDAQSTSFSNPFFQSMPADLEIYDSTLDDLSPTYTEELEIIIEDYTEDENHQAELLRADELDEECLIENITLPQPFITDDETVDHYGYADDDFDHEYQENVNVAPVVPLYIGVTPRTAPTFISSRGFFTNKPTYTRPNNYSNTKVYAGRPSDFIAAIYNNNNSDKYSSTSAVLYRDSSSLNKKKPAISSIPKTIEFTPHYQTSFNKQVSSRPMNNLYSIAQHNTQYKPKVTPSAIGQMPVRLPINSSMYKYVRNQQPNSVSNSLVNTERFRRLDEYFTAQAIHDAENRYNEDVNVRIDLERSLLSEQMSSKKLLSVLPSTVRKGFVTSVLDVLEQVIVQFMVFHITTPYDKENQLEFAPQNDFDFIDSINFEEKLKTVFDKLRMVYNGNFDDMTAGLTAVSTVGPVSPELDEKKKIGNYSDDEISFVSLLSDEKANEDKSMEKPMLKDIIAAEDFIHDLDQHFLKEINNLFDSTIERLVSLRINPDDLDGSVPSTNKNEKDIKVKMDEKSTVENSENKLSGENIFDLMLGGKDEIGHNLTNHRNSRRTAHGLRREISRDMRRNGGVAIL